MAFDIAIRKSDLQSLENAIRRNPAMVKSATSKFFVEGIDSYKNIINRNPWRMGGSGGGAPVALVKGGHLRDTHDREFKDWEARIYPKAKYAPYVHGIKGMRRKRSYQLRPWLDYAQKQNRNKIRELSQKLLEDITKDLSK